jgi:hypothetical protein
MKIDSNSIKEGIHEAFSDWILNHEISFPALLEDAIEEAFGQWLENHSTQIIVQIAKSYAGLSPESARQR